MTVQFPSAVYWKGYLLPVADSYLLSCKSINHLCMVLFLGFLFCPTDLCVCFYVNTILFDCCNSVNSLKSRIWLLQICSSFPRLLWLLVYSLHAHFCWELFFFLNQTDSLPLRHQGSPLYIFCCCCLVVHSCPTLCDPMYCSMPIYVFQYSYTRCINIDRYYVLFLDWLLYYNVKTFLKNIFC